MPSLTPYLFVYGSLKRGGDPEGRGLMEAHAHFLREASIQARLYRVQGWPAAVASPNPQDRVHGEAYELKDPARALAALDAWEGPGYGRRLLPALLKDQGFEVECWAWLWTGPVDEAARLADGRWPLEAP